MKIGPRQLAALRALILDRHQAFIANFVNPAIISPETRERLERLGLINPKAETVKDAFVLGVLAAHAPKDGEAMTYQQLAARMEKQAIPLSAAEVHAVQVAEMSAGEYITGLATKVVGDTGRVVLNMSPDAVQEYHEAVQDVVSTAIRERQSLGQIKSELGHATQDWSRNLERVANTELVAAMSGGTARAAVAQSKGERVLACKSSSNLCCKYRQALFCVGATKIPRVYYLDELEANGTNVGRKASEWRACIGPTHPSCRCCLNILPKGFAFDDAGNLVPMRGEKLAAALARTQNVKDAPGALIPSG